MTCKGYVYVIKLLIVMLLVCEIFIKWDAIFCRCCGYRLRNGPRLFKHKAKLRIMEKQKEKEMQMQKAQIKNNIILHVL